MLDFIGKIFFSRTPEHIKTDTIKEVSGLDSFSDSPALENLNIANALVNHLNEILDWKDRIDAINYLSDNANSTAGNPTYVSKDDGMINSISILGGSGNEVDFNLAKTAVEIVLDMYDMMALSSLTGINND